MAATHITSIRIPYELHERIMALLDVTPRSSYNALLVALLASGLDTLTEEREGAEHATAQHALSIG